MILRESQRFSAMAAFFNYKELIGSVLPQFKGRNVSRGDALPQRQVSQAVIFLPTGAGRGGEKRVSLLLSPRFYRRSA